MSEHSGSTTKKGQGRSSPRSDAVLVWIRNWASRRLPALVDSASIKFSRDYHQQKDIERIPDSIPPMSQHVALKRVFAAEFYTSAHVESLLSAFAELGWDSAETTRLRTNAADWVARSRKSSWGGWLNLGTIVSPNSKQRFSDATVITLPEGFDAAHVEFLSISASLSCIVVTFDATSENEENFERIARCSLGTELVRTKRGHSLKIPRLRKRRAITDARECFRRDILSWFKTNLPGAFSASNNLELFPTSELLFMDGVHIADDRSSNDQWMEYLGLEKSGVNRWNNAKFSGLVLDHPLSYAASQMIHCVFYIERNDLLALDNELYGGHNDDGYLNRLSMELGGFVGFWGINALLQLYQEELSTVRDGSSSLTQLGDPIKAIRRLQTVTSNSIDISLLAAELPVALPNVLWNDADFLQLRDDQSPRSFIDASTQRCIEFLEQLRKSDHSIRDLLVQQGNLINSMEAVESQRTMSKLTKWMTLLTIAIFILTAVMAGPVVLSKTSENEIVSEGEEGATTLER